MKKILTKDYDIPKKVIIKMKAAANKKHVFLKSFQITHFIKIKIDWSKNSLIQLNIYDNSNNYEALISKLDLP